MKPSEGRRRVVIEEIEPAVNGGRFPAKRVVGDRVTVTAALFSDGHDHVAARLLYRHTSEKKWQEVRFAEINNDMWTASFAVDQIGGWAYTIEAWVDHFDTWTHDLEKRLAAQPKPVAPLASAETPTSSASVEVQDIPLALRMGADLLQRAGQRAKGGDARTLKLASEGLRALAEQNLPYYDSPVTEELAELASRYPDLQFATRWEAEVPLWVDRERARYSSWYELFPRSAGRPGEHGTLRDVTARLPEIAAMGFDVLYMPPIHPIGREFRKGRNNAVTAQAGDVGSPWAIGAAEGGHTEILPELGTMEDFAELVRAARSLGIDIALDIAFQCAPDHPWVKTHPNWFLQRPDGTIQYAENPPKKYQDIYPLNFETPDWRRLWDALAGVFEFWVDHGVRVFRVDNPHTKALPFWEWCIAEVQKSTPETLFLAEAFTRPHVMYSLAKAGFTQSYTYFTWRAQKAELEEYFTEITQSPVAEFFRPNVWPNTPDILHAQFQVAPLAERRSIFQQRVILAATLSANYGIYGPAYELLEGRAAKPSAGKTASEEYLDSEKYQIREWDRSDPNSIAPLVTRLNAIRRENRALQQNGSLHFHECANPQLMVYSKATDDGSNVVLTVVSLDTRQVQAGIVVLDLERLGVAKGAVFTVEEMLTGASYRWQGAENYVSLDPGLPAHVLRVTVGVVEG